MEKNLSEANTTNELVVLNANGTTFDSTTRIAVIIVDGNENDWEVQLHSIVQKLKDHHIFVIAVFIANRYNWTFDKSIMFNIDSWIVAQSKEEATELAEFLKRIVNNHGLINMDVNDIRTILIGNKRAWFTTGADDNGSLANSIGLAIERIDNQGVDIKSFQKYMIIIEDNSNPGENQMSALNDFINKLTDKNNTEIKWGFYQIPTMPGNTIALSVLATD